jgi:hypothetical protein
MRASTYEGASSRSLALTLDGPLLYWFLGFHLLIGLVLRSSSQAGSVYRLAMFGVAGFVVLFARRAASAACALAYVSTAEVLWRISGVESIWEFGKYALLSLAVLALMRFFRRKRRIGLLVTYAALLLPAAYLTLHTSYPVESARSEIAFNLSGPIALAVCAIFFAQGTYGWHEIRKILWTTLAPITAVAAATLYATLTSGAIAFTNESNFTTSAGFGPNQVSTVLSFGALVCFFLAVREKRLAPRNLAIVLAIWFLTQDLLTFSRGGVYALAAGVILGSIYYVQDPRRRIQAVVILAVGFVALTYAVLPRLESFTQNELQVRLKNTDSTGRFDFVRADLEVWARHPLLGVGPGMAKFARVETGVKEPVAAHTEFTRMLAEHGLPGMVALLCLLFLIMRCYRRARDSVGRAWVVALGGWWVVAMSTAAMRIAVIPLAFSLIMIEWRQSPDERSKGQAGRSGETQEFVVLARS